MITDIRLPIGLLFSFFGVVLAVFGLATQGSVIYKASLGININVYTGACLIAFGAFMLFMAWRGKKAKTAP